MLENIADVNSVGVRPNSDPANNLLKRLGNAAGEFVPKHLEPGRLEGEAENVVAEVLAYFMKFGFVPAKNLSPKASPEEAAEMAQRLLTSAPWLGKGGPGPAKNNDITNAVLVLFELGLLTIGDNRDVPMVCPSCGALEEISPDAIIDHFLAETAADSVDHLQFLRVRNATDQDTFEDVKEMKIPDGLTSPSDRPRERDATRDSIYPSITPCILLAKQHDNDEVMRVLSSCWQSIEQEVWLRSSAVVNMGFSYLIGPDLTDHYAWCANGSDTIKSMMYHGRTVLPLEGDSPSKNLLYVKKAESGVKFQVLVLAKNCKEELREGADPLAFERSISLGFRDLNRRAKELRRQNARLANALDVRQYGASLEDGLIRGFILCDRNNVPKKVILSVFRYATDRGNYGASLVVDGSTNLAAAINARFDRTFAKAFPTDLRKRWRGWLRHNLPLGLARSSALAGATLLTYIFGRYCGFTRGLCENLLAATIGLGLAAAIELLAFLFDAIRANR